MFLNKSWVILFLILSGCAPTLPVKKTGSDLEKSIPSEFSSIKSSNESSAKFESQWQNFYLDKELKSLIDSALKSNIEFLIMGQEVYIANNEVMERGGEYLPKVGLKGGYETEKVGEVTSRGASDASSTYDNGKHLPSVLHNHSLGLSASWELDVWGKLRNATKAAYYNYLATLEGQNFLKTQLVAEIATGYYELKALDKQLEIVENYVRILNEAKSLLALQLSAAKVTSLAVKRFEAEVLKNQSEIFEIKQRIIETENKVNFLLGRFPQSIKRSATDFIEQEFVSIDSGVPSRLLENRPDVKESLLRLEGAKLNVKVAKARFYPALSIEAGVGFEAFNSEHLFKNPQSLFYNLGVNLTAPLLNRQAIQADYFSANNKQIQAIYEFEKTLLKAFTEVAIEVSNIKNLTSVYDLKRQQVKLMVDSVEVSNFLFKNARVDYIEALLTQRDSLEAKVELVKVKKEQLLAYVNLYRALGGGWQVEKTQVAKLK